MKTRTLAVMLVTLLLVAGAATLIIRQKTTERASGIQGTRLLDPLPANEIVSITLTSAKETVSLVKRTDEWTVEDRFDYPADFAKISDIVRKLKQAEIGRKFESSEETLKRLSLKDPNDPETPEEQKGTRIDLKDKQGQLLASVLLGKTRNAGTERSVPGGQYVRLDQDSTVYLIDKHFASLQTERSTWLEKRLVNVAAEEVKKIVCQSSDDKRVRYVLERPERDKELQLLEAPNGQQVKASALNSLQRGLSSLRMEDVVNGSTLSHWTAKEFPARLEYQLFSGIIYRVYLGDQCTDARGCRLKLEVDYGQLSKPDKETDEETSGQPAQASPDKTAEELALEAKQLNERLSPWVYLVPKWQHDAFVTDRDQLLEKPDNTP
ncbi:MAG: DUF4340 domain-containing protein [Deltaproteobacteria bacterium]|nr:MAG: DUF4340 domain-containing protein [Deltaproteobacteria bacterium]